MQLDMNLLNLFRQGNGLIFAGSLIVAAALFLAAHSFSSFFLYFSRRKLPTLRKVKLAPVKKMMTLLVAIACVFIGTTLIFGGMTIKTYVVFNRADKIGIVECLAWNQKEQFMVVSLTPVKNGQPGNSQTFSLYGDHWEVSAHILKWHANLNLIGLHTGYRLNQIKGIYSQAADENEKPHRAYALSNGTDMIWGILSQYGGKIPFVNAVYGNAVSRPANTGERFDVFVTTSGLTVRPHQ